MDMARTGGRRVIERRVEIARESLLAPRQGGKAEAFALRFTGSGVDADDGEAELLGAAAHLGRRNLRNRAFDTGKPRPLGRFHALREGQLEVEKAQMGGEAKHEASFCR